MLKKVKFAGEGSGDWSEGKADDEIHHGVQVEQTSPQLASPSGWHGWMLGDGHAYSRLEETDEEAAMPVSYHAPPAAPSRASEAVVASLPLAVQLSSTPSEFVDVEDPSERWQPSADEELGQTS